MNETKLVTYKNLHVGQEIKGYETEKKHCGFTAYVKCISPAYVYVEMWRKGGKVEKIDSTVMFSVELTESEIQMKYRTKAKEVMKNIQNKLYRDEIGYHEMNNSWLSYDPYEMAQWCAKEKIKIVGHCVDITPKTAMFSGEKLDVGVCAEYEDGERFWCHYKSAYMLGMLDDYSDLLR